MLAWSPLGDVERWVRAFAESGFEASDEDIYTAWQKHSEKYSAGWLASYGNDERDGSALLAQLEPE